MAFLDGVGEFLTGKGKYDFTSDTLLGINAAFDNLFEVNLVSHIDSPNLSDFPVKNISQIDIPQLQVNLKRATLTRKYHIQEDSVVYYDEASITFLEDSEFSVSRFFNKWREKYYDIENNCWVSGSQDKYINLKIKLSQSSISPFDPASVALSQSRTSKDLIIRLDNVSLPTPLPTFKLEYSKSDPISHTLKFPVERVSFDYGIPTIRNIGDEV